MYLQKIGVSMNKNEEIIKGWFDHIAELCDKDTQRLDGILTSQKQALNTIFAEARNASEFITEFGFKVTEEDTINSLNNIDNTSSNLLIWHPIVEEPTDKHCMLWFLSSNSKGAKIRRATWVGVNIRCFQYWAYPVLPPKEKNK